jgi:hypothetical protein
VSLRPRRERRDARLRQRAAGEILEGSRLVGDEGRRAGGGARKTIAQQRRQGNGSETESDEDGAENGLEHLEVPEGDIILDGMAGLGFDFVARHSSVIAEDDVATLSVEVTEEEHPVPLGIDASGVETLRQDVGTRGLVSGSPAAMSSTTLPDGIVVEEIGATTPPLEVSLPDTPPSAGRSAETRLRSPRPDTPVEEDRPDTPPCPEVDEVGSLARSSLDLQACEERRQHEGELRRTPEKLLTLLNTARDTLNGHGRMLKDCIRHHLGSDSSLLDQVMVLGESNVRPPQLLKFGDDRFLGDDGGSGSGESSSRIQAWRDGVDERPPLTGEGEDVQARLVGMLASELERRYEYPPSLIGRAD